jgi:hypothetical protein
MQRLEDIIVEQERTIARLDKILAAMEHQRRLERGEDGFDG